MTENEPISAQLPATPAPDGAGDVDRVESDGVMRWGKAVPAYLTRADLDDALAVIAVRLDRFAEEQEHQRKYLNRYEGMLARALPEPQGSPFQEAAHGTPDEVARPSIHQGTPNLHRASEGLSALERRVSALEKRSAEQLFAVRQHAADIAVRVGVLEANEEQRREAEEQGGA